MRPGLLPVSGVLSRKVAKSICVHYHVHLWGDMQGMLKLDHTTHLVFMRHETARYSSTNKVGFVD